MGTGSSSHRKKQKKRQSEVPNCRKHPYQVAFDDFQILRAIGKGSFGKVCIVQKKDTMKMYAMKYMNKLQCVEKDAFSNVLKEIQILTSLEHPFLVNLWFTFQDEEDMFMVVDLLLGGDLRYHLQQESSHFTEARVTLYVCEIALALDYLRSRKIIHRDVKPDNILLDDAGHAHLTDFNIATVVLPEETVISVCGTKPYMAPEVTVCALDHSKGYSFEADWWSLGVTAFEMINRKRPYDIHSDTTIEEIHDMIRNTCLRFPRGTDKGIIKLIQTMMAFEPSQRTSSVEKLRSLPFVSSIDFTAVLNGQVSPSFIPNKNRLNCDPTFELEEMIIEAKPLHKKKKRLSKRNKARTSQSPEAEEDMKSRLDSIHKKFIIYNREWELQKKEAEAKGKTCDETLKIGSS